VLFEGLIWHDAKPHNFRHPEALEWANGARITIFLHRLGFVKADRIKDKEKDLKAIVLDISLYGWAERGDGGDRRLEM